MEPTSRGAPGLGAKKGLAAAKGSGSGSGSNGGAAGGGGGAFAGWRLDQSVRDTTTRRHLDAVKRLGAWAESTGEAGPRRSISLYTFGPLWAHLAGICLHIVLGRGLGSSDMVCDLA